ncbi:hypothetical protein [Streptomyces sp. NPDC050704]|uniref:hypothetical protein n=1 Tax=Streptomyces sp. NPDC050704 TaxID=3157219 RepID=UPI00343A3AF6
MAPFYGVFAFVGTEARSHLEAGACLSSVLALAYGSGFAVAGATHRWAGRWEQSLLPLTFAGLIGIYALLPFVDRALPTLLAAAAAWGFIN